MDRRTFVAVTAAELAALAAAGCGPGRPQPLVFPSPEPPPPPSGRTDTFDVAVIGAGAFGGWTALHLRQQGASVALIDQFGPGNSRATSGDETRGVRTSYGDRTHGRDWMRWARDAIGRWQRFDQEWKDLIGGQLFFTTGDLILRANPDELFVKRTREWWQEVGIRHELLSADEVRHRWPVIDVTGINAVLYEPDAGVVRSRRACEAVGVVFEKLGGVVRIGHARLAERQSRTLGTVGLANGDRIAAGTFCFACGPWLPKVFPDLLAPLMNLPVGHVCYFATPPGDDRFTWPNLPSWNFPGVTGWPALVPDNRGFRVRTTGERAFDPDLSQRIVPKQSIERNRKVLETRFPLLARAPLSETRACHYESSATRNFLIDRHPDFDNVWIAGGGSAEGFKFGPVVGDYVAGRLLGREGDPDLAEGFSIPREPVAAQPTRSRGS